MDIGIAALNFPSEGHVKMDVNYDNPKIQPFEALLDAAI